MIEIIEPGLAVAAQDLGRTGLRRFGVPLSGGLDMVSLRAANYLVGNQGAEAVFEILATGPRLRATQFPVGIGLTGAITAQKTDAEGGIKAIESWRSVLLLPGEELAIRAGGHGIGYVALSGGVQTPPVLGSRSVYRRAALGGFLCKGQMIPCGPGMAPRQGPALTFEDGPIRLLPGPQDDHFDPATLALFTQLDYRVGRESDRMGLRLEGPVLPHNAKGPEIDTDGVLPGSIQVPGNGLPILLLNDAQTSGGYAKIATVIAADLPRLAHLRPGAALRFVFVDRETARHALRRQEQDLVAWRDALLIGEPGAIDEAALYRENLISGVTKAEGEDQNE